MRHMPSSDWDLPQALRYTNESANKMEQRGHDSEASIQSEMDDLRQKAEKSYEPFRGVTGGAPHTRARRVEGMDAHTTDAPRHTSVGPGLKSHSSWLARPAGLAPADSSEYKTGIEYLEFEHDPLTPAQLLLFKTFCTRVLAPNCFTQTDRLGTFQ